jgi:hypothetical protein
MPDHHDDAVPGAALKALYKDALSRHALRRQANLNVYIRRRCFAVTDLGNRLHAHASPHCSWLLRSLGCRMATARKAHLLPHA